MEFSQLPEAMFLQIFRFLPLGNQIRLSRVNQDFQMISEKAISQITHIDFRDDNSIQDISLEWFKILIEACSNNLKEIYFGGTAQMEAFSKITYPRLEEIVFDGNISNEAFGRLFENNKNLRVFRWVRMDGFVSLPAYFRYPTHAGALMNLEWLELPYCNDVAISSLIGQCPKLKTLRLHCEVTQSTLLVLDDLFRGSPNIDSIWLYGSDGAQSVDFTCLVNFWQLTLVGLHVDYPMAPGTDDNFLVKIATSFRNMEELRLHRLKATSVGIQALASLGNLQSLYLSECENIDDGIRQLTSCKRLVCAWFTKAGIATDTFKALVENCQELILLEMNQLLADTSIQPASVIDSISTDNFKIEIRIDIRDQANRGIWKSEEVKEALKKLKETAGHNIQFSKLFYITDFWPMANSFQFSWPF